MRFTENTEENNTKGQIDNTRQIDEANFDEQQAAGQKDAKQAGDEKKKLIFRIVDSPMGIGKSSALMTNIRFNVAYHEDDLVDSLKRTGLFNDLEHRRFIIFVATVKERDERFLQQLKAKCPERPPYSRSILELIRNGENIVTTQSLYGFFNEETIKAFRKSPYPYTAYFDEIPPLFREVVGSKQKKDSFGAIARFGKSDVLLMQKDGIITRKGEKLVYNRNSDYARQSSDHKVFDAIKNLSRSCDLYPFGDRQGKFTSIIAFMKRELFTCFDQCWFFSYLTKDSMLARYCAMNDIAMEYYHVEKGFIKHNPEGKYQESYPQGIERLVILEDKRFNPDETLSKEWFKAARNGKNGEGLKKLLGCFRSAYTFMKQKGVRSDSFMFTTFTAYQNLLDGDGYNQDTAYRFEQLPATEQKDLYEYLLHRKRYLNITVNGQKYLLVHGASPNEYTGFQKVEYQSLTKFVVWHRYTDDFIPGDGSIMIFGHTPTVHYQRGDKMSIWHGNHVIGIDCGCGFHSERVGVVCRLACLRLEDMKEFYSEE